MEVAEEAPRSADIVVVGTGPAGLAVAAACAECGLDTVVVDPRPQRPWPQTFAAWADELPPGSEAMWARSWSDVRVITDRRHLHVDRRYVLLDNAALRHRLAGRLAHHGGAVLAGAVRGVRTGEDRLTVRLDTDREIRARAVVDASGHRPALVTAPVGPPPAMQTAYGLIGTFAVPPTAPGAMTFMDLSTPDLPAPAGEGLATLPPGSPPSFLYAMDLGEGRWLVEETCLAARPAVAIATLAQRLERRLSARGAQPTTVERTERVAFPMGSALPHLPQPVIGFGAAAGMVHPATGYSVARSLRLARPVAEALATSVAGGDSAMQVAAAGWSAVWTPDTLRQRALHLFGLAALLSLNPARTQEFFAEFFSLPRQDWSAYVSGAPSVRAAATTMRRVFLAAPGPLKGALVGAAVRNPGLLLGAAVPARGGIRPTRDRPTREPAR